MKLAFLALSVLGVLVSVTYLALPWLLSLRGVQMYRRGPLGTALVFESPDEDGTTVRLLNVDGTFQSASYVSDELWSELVCVYHREMVKVINAMGDAQEERVIVGGGYSLPKYLATHTKYMRITVVEIDPAMTKIAREKFFLDRAESQAGERLEIVHADGWEWLRASGRHFDVIINDAFMGNKPLGRLSTEEGAELVAEHLSGKGVYLANVRCPLEGQRSRPLQDVTIAFGRHLARVWTLPERPETPREPGNNVLVASNRKLDL